MSEHKEDYKALKKKYQTLQKECEQIAIELENVKNSNSVALEKGSIYTNELFELLPIGLALCDLKGNLLDVNKSYADIIGYTPDETKELTYWEITPQKYEPEESVILRELETNGSYGPYEKEYIHKDGHLIPVRLQGKIIEIAGEKYIWSSVEDITTTKKYEAELIREKEKAEESDRLKTEFLDNMSHEIRTPMTGIIGFAKLLQNFASDEEKRRNFTDIIVSSSYKLLDIMDNILEISRLNTHQVEINNSVFNLNEKINHLADEYRKLSEEKGIALGVVKGLIDSESTISSDVNKITSIIKHLMVNAFKFTVKGSVELGYYVKHHHLCIYVKDSGIGIAEDQQNHIFKRFYQEEKDLSSKVGGLGLGLSIAKEKAALLNGDILVESKKKLGSIFTLEIPYVKVEVAANVRATHVKPENMEVVKILIAEDSDVNSLFIKTILESKLEKEIDIVHVDNGQIAVDYYNEHRDVSIIIMDLKMPIMDGYEATKRIKEINSNVPIIVQSAFIEASEREKAYHAGCNAYLTKPIDGTTLLKLVSKYI